MPSALNWDDFKYFLALARRGRLKSAGSDVGVDQATVGRRIAALEGELGDRLFEKTAKGYELTETGHRLLPFAEHMESQALAAREARKAAIANISGSVRVGAPVAAGSYLISAAASDLIRRHPKLEIQIVAVPRVFNLSVREADFAISVSRPDRGRLVSRKITDYILRLYAHEDYLRGMPPIASVADLRRHRGIGYISDLIFDKELDYVPSIDPKLRPRLTSSNLIVQLQCTLERGGLCILPDFVAREHACLRPVLEETVMLTRSFWLVIHEDLAKVERIRLVAERFADAIRLGAGTAQEAGS
jgi:DNA-binding transcriptional LysR family regulator